MKDEISHNQPQAGPKPFPADAEERLILARIIYFRKHNNWKRPLSFAKIANILNDGGSAAWSYQSVFRFYG